MDAQKLYCMWEYNDVDRAFWREHLENFVPARLIDAHTHVWHSDTRVEPMSEEMRRQYWVNELNNPISPQDAKRCYDTVFPNRQVQCVAFGQVSYEWDVKTIEQRLATEVPALGWKRLAVVAPQTTARELDAILDQPDTIGVKVYYSLIGYDPLTRDKYLECSIFDYLPHHQLEVLNRRRAWVTLHVPRAGRLCHPDNLREVKAIREKYPDVLLVIAHFGRCYTLPHAEKAFVPLADDAGLYFDNSAVLNPDVHRLALEMFGPDRILYGTDNPIFYMRGRQQWAGEKYINRTSYPFYFNKDREPADVEATYTLYMYEALKAIKDAAAKVGLARADVEKLFYRNAKGLIDRACR